MTFAPLKDSTKPSIEHQELVPAKELKLVYAFEFPLKTYMFSAATFLLGLSALGFWMFNDERQRGKSIFQIGMGIMVFIVILFLCLYRFSPNLFDNVVINVRDAEDAVARVNSGHITILGLLTLAFYKICKCNKPEMANEQEEQV